MEPRHRLPNIGRLWLLFGKSENRISNPSGSMLNKTSSIILSPPRHRVTKVYSYIENSRRRGSEKLGSTIDQTGSGFQVSGGLRLAPRPLPITLDAVGLNRPRPSSIVLVLEILLVPVLIPASVPLYVSVRDELLIID